MIGKLTGTVDTRRRRLGVIDVGGVGYLLVCSARDAARACAASGSAASAYVETHVREDHIHLYGFADDGRARLVPPADDRPGRRRAGRAGDPERAVAATS